MTLPLLLCGFLTVAGQGAAQTPAAPPTAVETVPAEIPPTRPATLLLDMPGGAPREYQTDEFSISISRTMDGRGDSRGDVTISTGSVRPLDDALLQWARQGDVGADASRRASITVPPTVGPVPTAAMRYELEGAKVVGINVSHSTAASTTQIMLQIAVRRVTLNGIVMN